LKEVPGFEESVDGTIMELINLMETKYLSTDVTFKPLDLATICQYFTLDTLTSVAFGSPFGFLAADDDIYDYIKSLTPLMPIMELQANITWIGAILNTPFIKKLITPTANDGSAMGRMVGFAQSTVAKRFGPKAEEKQDILGSFIRHGLTQLEAESESLLQIMAGADSTATAIRITMWYVMSNPLVYSKLQKEIDEADAKGLLSSPVISDAEAKMLPYLQAVIKEGLRIWPPGAGISTKFVPPEGEVLADGRFIPGGTRLAWAAWGTQHNKAVYGEDARLFRPERWLELPPDSEQMIAMERTHEMIFGTGRYGCLGKRVAFVELNKIFATVSLRI
jgi:cytochrome P450